MSHRLAGMRLALLGVCLLVSVGAARAQMSGMTTGGRLTEEVYKNIQVLRGIPAEQLQPTMQFVADSLGVRCSFCHVSGANDRDDKEQKQTARRMMQMVLAVNKNSFGGRRVVTCYTCHRGSSVPVGTPVISDSGATRTSDSSEQVPGADQLLDRYLQSVGGMSALAKITSRVGTGKKEDPANLPSPYEVYSVPSGKRLIKAGSPGNETLIVYNGDAGWISLPGRGARDMSPSELERTKLEDDLYLATHVKQLYSQWRVSGPETIGDHDAYVLDGSETNHVSLRLYLDQESGILLRLIHYTETPLGDLPTQVDYSDYRVIDGVKAPFRTYTITPNSRDTIQLDHVEQNGAIEDFRFSRPSPPQ